MDNNGDDDGVDVDPTALRGCMTFLQLPCRLRLLLFAECCHQIESAAASSAVREREKETFKYKGLIRTKEGFLGFPSKVHVTCCCLLLAAWRQSCWRLEH